MFDLVKQTWREIAEALKASGCSFAWLQFLFVLIVMVTITSYLTGC